jgi:hypothetical protein
MTSRFVLNLQVGPDSLVIGPPGAFGGRSDGSQMGRPGVNGREDARRWLIRVCQEPGARIQLRQHLILWTGDAHHINYIADRDLPNYLADLCSRGSLSMWASRPMGGHDAHNLSQVKPQSTARGPIETWSIGARIEAVLRHVPENLSSASREEFLKLVAPEAIKVTASVLSLWSGGRAFGTSEVIDVILLALAHYPLSRSVRDVADKIGHVLELVISARSDTDLSEAARELAEVVTLIGLAAFVALISHAASKASKGALKAKKAPVRRNSVPAA